MPIWLVRAGQHGENEESAIERSVAVIGWDDLPDLTPVNTREALTQLMQATYPDEGRRRLANWTGQVWAFRDRIQKDDWIVLPLKHRSAIAVGRVTGPYQYLIQGQDGQHARPVKWLKTDLPRSAFDQDLLYSFGAFMTVCQISRNNAETRIKQIVDAKQPIAEKPSTSTVDDFEPEADRLVDIEQYAEDRLRDYIERKFKGHALARLVDALLKATGYTTVVSPPGPDGGVDIVAGRGALGFDSPRLCVQVKSSSSPANAEVIERLHGSMKRVSAEHGLFVSWGGFISKVSATERSEFFSIRLWNSRDLINALLNNYEQLSPDLQAELPLKKIWALVE